MKRDGHLGEEAVHAELVVAGCAAEDAGAGVFRVLSGDLAARRAEGVSEVRGQVAVVVAEAGGPDVGGAGRRAEGRGVLLVTVAVV
jgi:hypothetical protein